MARAVLSDVIRKVGLLSVDRLLLVLMLSGCAATLKSRVDTTLADDAWHEVRGSHVVLTTNLEPEAARAMGAALDQGWAVLTLVYRANVSERIPTRTLRLTHIARCDDFARVRRGNKRVKGIAGKLVRFEGESSTMTCGKPARATAVALHELAHLFNAHAFRGGAVWLNEGLATYLESLSWRQGKIRVGLPSRADYFRSLKDLPSIEELRAQSRREFYSRGRQNYRAAWKVVHLLITRYPQQFRVYIGHMAAGVLEATAWRLAFSEISNLESQHATYLVEDKVMFFRDLDDPVPVATSQALRVLGLGESHAMWARVALGRRDRQGLVDALGYIDRGAQKDPTWKQAGYWRAAVLGCYGEEGERASALDMLRGRRVSHPKDALTLAARVDLELALETGAEIDTDVEELKSVAPTARLLRVLGSAHAVAGRTQQGFETMMQAVTLDPGCIECYVSAAKLANELGKSVESIVLQGLAIRLSVDRSYDGHNARVRAFEKYVKDAKTRESSK